MTHGARASLPFLATLATLVPLVGALGACGSDDKTVEVPGDDGRTETKVIETGGPCEVLLSDGLKLGKDVECGHVASPLDYDAPAKGTLRVAYFRVLAKDREGAKTPVFIHFGGPGDDGTNPMRVAMKLRATLGTDRDIVAIGQRGTTFSANFPSCEAPDAEATTAAAAAAVLRGWSKDCKKALDDSGFDVRRFSTTAAVRDVEALRKGLGYGKIAFWGVSYGTTFALELMRQFPDTVDRAILDSVIGPDFPRATYFVDQFIDLPPYLKILGDACLSTATCKAEVGEPSLDFSTDFTSALERARKTPLQPFAGETFTDTDLLAFSRGAGMGEIDRDFFGFFVHGLSRTTGTFDADGIDEGLAAAVDRLAKGFGYEADAKTILEYLFDSGDGKGFAAGHNDALGCAELFNGSASAVGAVLASGSYARLPAPFKAAITDLAVVEEARCSAFRGVFDERMKTFGKAVSTPTRALVLNGVYDSATPAKYARLVAKRLPNATLREVPCKAHGVILSSLAPEDLKCSSDILRAAVDGEPAKVDVGCLCEE